MQVERAPEKQADLVEQLKPVLARRHGVSPDTVEHLQTHISHVLLVGDRAYKIKKPVNFGFLDFSTLARRKQFCAEELRLNRRLAGALYEKVEPVSGPMDAPRPGESDDPVEYMVLMRRFDQDRQLDRVAAAGALSLGHMDEMATQLARFHEQAAVAGSDTRFGTPQVVFAPMEQNFEQIAEFLQEPSSQAQLERIAQWTRARHADLTDLIARRRADGQVRECHGDMHLANMALFDDELVIFDGIEFNDDFRWIDVANDLAFLLMDLEDRGLMAHARRLLNRYLEIRGDYDALPLLRFYQVYRAVVRAKVALLGLHHADEAARSQIWQTYHRYADLAERLMGPLPRFLAITHGVSGSGKSIASRAVVEATGAIQIRSDAIRQRLFGPERDRSGQDIYTPEATEATYRRLEELAGEILDAGYPAVADATFLASVRRAPWPEIARAKGVGFHILDMHCDRETLERFVSERLESGQDISEADLSVLHGQLARREPLSAAEQARALRIRCDAPIASQVADWLDVLLPGPAMAETPSAAGST
ncbi:MAG: AAA family ATPase [Halothiobacillaceae bacterium]